MEAVEGLEDAREVDESVRSVAQLAGGKEVREAYSVAKVCTSTTIYTW